MYDRRPRLAQEVPPAGVRRAEPSRSLLDILDRVLDKGIVIDAWLRLSLVGVDLITVEARVVVASIETHLKYAELLTRTFAPPTNTR